MISCQASPVALLKNKEKSHSKGTVLSTVNSLNSQSFQVVEAGYLNRRVKAWKKVWKLLW